MTERQLNQALAKKMVGKLMNRVSTMTTACERRSSLGCVAHTDGAPLQLCQLAFAQWVAVMERVRARRQDDVKNVDDEAW